MSIEQLIIVAYITVIIVLYVKQIGTIGESAVRSGKSGSFLIAVLLVAIMHLTAIWALFSGGFFE